MVLAQSLLNRAFPWMAVSGLLLVGWGLLVTPDEINPGAQGGLWQSWFPPALSSP